MVFTFPKVIRVFFRHDRKLYGEISRLIYRIIQTFLNAAAGRKIQSAAVIAYASAGKFARFNSHIHAIVLEALKDLALNHLTVIYPGDRAYPLADRVDVVPFVQAIQSSDHIAPPARMAG